MLNLTKIYFGISSESDSLRYGNGSPRSAADRRPVVVWTFTRTCNLRCQHCYTDSAAKRYSGELTTEEAHTLIEELADYKVPAVLFSGGEPLTRPDLFELAHHAKESGLRCTLSTNGTLISEAIAWKIQEAGFRYVGISLDGPENIHDNFRGVQGAYSATIRGIKNCLAIGQKVGLRLTLTRHTAEALDNIFDLVYELGISRICFYHLAYSGRGRSIQSEDLTHKQTRAALDRIIDRTREALDRGQKLEVLTVDNAVDGAYLYLKLKKEDSSWAKDAYKLLLWNGGGRFSSGVGIVNVDSQGNVHPDQFWQSYTLGNIRDRSFEDIVTDPDEPLLVKLRDRLRYLTGRCHECQYVEICGGALRVRAAVATGDPWAPDPACYLTDQEIGVGVTCPT